LSTPIYYNRLDALRCYAVIAVLFSHFFNPNITQYLFIGNAGVNLFFVISGFLITEILFKYKDSGSKVGASLKKFYIRRFLRIFPIYYMYLVIAALLYYSLVKDALPWAFLYGINFYEQNHTVPVFFSHLWSLSIEEQFYLIWPFIILTIPKKMLLKLIVAVILIALFSRLFISGINHKLLTTSCFDAFGLGALFAYLKLYHQQKLQQILKYNIFWITALLAYAAMIICSIYQIPILDEWFRFFISIISFYLIGVALYPTQPTNKLTKILLENKTVIYLGTISYGIYIYHLLIGYILDPYINQYLSNLFASKTSALKYIYFNSYLIKLPLYTILTIAVAAFSFRFIEKPISAFKNRLTV